MMQRFTDDAQRVLSLAQEAALELGHDYVGTEGVKTYSSALQRLKIV